ncbi:MAG: hypothetical protein E7Z86_02900 [Methanosphaera stadtmanae]|jgi:hypothetical protein|nr:hypothetical protein [Methanosphaera stadtmanae]
MKQKNIIVLLIFTILFLSLSAISASNITDNSFDNSDGEQITSNFTIMKNEDLKNENIKKDINSNYIQLTSNNFYEYVTDGKFNDKVSDGDTVDFQGKFDSGRFDLTIDKPVNITSTTNDSYINIHSIKLDDYTESGGAFKLVSGSSGTNITGLNFENTRISIRNVSDININNCSVIADTIVGRGVGMFSVGGDSNNVNITNCYFEKIGGQHSSVVFSGATNVIFENNTIVGTGSVGNLLYLTTYNSNSNYDKYSNQNFTIRNNYIDGNKAAVQEICYAAALEGNNLLIENNTIEYGGKCLIPQWGGGNQNNITVINNTIPYGTCYLSFPNQTIIGNVINNLQSNNNALYNNTIKNITTLGNLTLEDNKIETVTINGSNVLINNNNITTTNNYTINIYNTSSNITITNNKLASAKFRGIETINGSAEIIENNIEGNMIININNDNYKDYFYEYANKRRTIVRLYPLSILQENDILIYNMTDTITTLYNHVYNEDDNIIPLIFINSSFNVKALNLDNCTLINCTGYGVSSALSLSNGTVINSSFINSQFSTCENSTIINSTFLGLNAPTGTELDQTKNSDFIDTIRIMNYVLTDENTYVMTSTSLVNSCIDSSTGLLNDSVIEGDIIYVRDYENNNLNIIVDRPVNLIGGRFIGVINANITFIEGSEGTNITNITFNGTVNVNTTDINFLDGNTFNGEVNNPYIPEINIPVTISMDYPNKVENHVSTPVMINVTTVDGTPVSNGYVEVYADGILQNKENLTDGTINTNISLDRVLNTTIKVWYYPEDNTYLQNNTVFDITSIKSNVTLSLENNTVRVNENETVTVLVKADNNITVNDGNVTFIIRSWKFIVPVEDGMAKLNLIVNQSWYERPTLRLIYSGSDLFEYQSTSSLPMDILEALPITLKVDTTEFTAGTATNIQASIYKGNDTYTKINKGKITFKVNGKTLKDSNGKVIYAKVTNGTATIENYEIPASWNNSTVIEAVYSGSTQQESLKSEKTNLTIAPTTPTMTVDNITTSPAQTIKITAQITQSDNPINTGKIVFKINGKILKDDNGKVIYAKVVNGVATINYTLPETLKVNTYEIKAVFMATGYEKLESTSTLTITKD